MTFPLTSGQLPSTWNLRTFHIAFLQGSVKLSIVFCMSSEAQHKHDMLPNLYIFTESAPQGQFRHRATMFVSHLSAPSNAVFLGASHRPWGHMISSRPLIGPPSPQKKSPPSPIFFFIFFWHYTQKKISTPNFFFRTVYADMLDPILLLLLLPLVDHSRGTHGVLVSFTEFYCV